MDEKKDRNKNVNSGYPQIVVFKFLAIQIGVFKVLLIFLFFFSNKEEKRMKVKISELSVDIYKQAYGILS